jgi:catalase
VMTPDARDRLTTNIAGAMRNVSNEIKRRQIGHFTKADPAYGAAVERKLSALGGANKEAAVLLSVAKEA